MDLTGIFFILIVSCSFSASGAQVQSRGFFGSKDSENPDLVEIDLASAATLKSPLTTVFFPIVYIFVFVVGLPANGMAIWVFLIRNKKKHPSTIYMANLALADLLFVVWLPLKIYYHVNGNDWIFGEPMCKVLVSFFYGNMYSSMLFIACLSVQRCWVVKHPLSTLKKNNKVALSVCAGVWAYIWLSTTPLYLYDHTAKLKEPNVTTCHDVTVIDDPADPGPSVRLPFYYFIYTAASVFFVACVVNIAANVVLLRALGDSMGDSDAAKNRHKALVLIVIVLVTFLLCFVPSNIMLVQHYVLLRDGVLDNGYGFYVSTLCLASLNSCLDPFIYYYVSDDFRDHVKNTLLCKSDRAVKSMKASFTSMKYSRKSKSYTSESANTQSSSC